MSPSNAHRLDSERSDTRLRCPKDGTLMEREQIRTGSVGESVSVDRCAKCGALWLDKGEMEKIIACGSSAAKQADLGPFGKDKPNGPIAPLACPRDGTIMTEIADKQQKHVLIMLCTDCHGKLLDAGELTDLSDYTITERLRAALKLG